MVVHVKWTQTPPSQNRPEKSLKIGLSRTPFRLELGISSSKYNRGPWKVGSGMVARTQLPRKHELEQEARAHARSTPSMGMIYLASPWARASTPKPHVPRLESAP
jgi:hypothetical protein